MRGRRHLRLALLGLGTAIVPLDTAVNIAFPDITGSFRLPIAMIQWVVIAYLLTYASLLLAFGRIGDSYGHGRIFRLGLSWSVIAFLLCAAAPTYDWLLFFRFLQGIGAAFVISASPALVTGLYPEERRGRALGAFTMMFAIGSAAGPLLGGALVAHWGWPAVFWFRAPLALLSVVFLRGLPAAPRRVGEPLDVPGAFLLAFGLAALLLLLNERRLLWALPLLSAALLALSGFVFWERRVSRPIVDLDLFRNRAFLFLNLASAVVNLAAFAVLLFVPYYLVRLTRLPLAVSGAVLAASFLGMMLSSPLAGVLLDRIAAHRLAALGAGLGGLGLIVMGSLSPSLSFEWAAILVSLLLQGAGLGLFQVAYMEVVMRALPRADRGVAGGLSMLTRTIGIVLGATLLSLLFHAFAQEGFLAAFHATFRLAGALSAAAATLILLRGRES